MLESLPKMAIIATALVAAAPIRIAMHVSIKTLLARVAQHVGRAPRQPKRTGGAISTFLSPLVDAVERTIRIGRP